MVSTPFQNPFFHRGPIRDPAFFFGRQSETGLLLSLIRNAQSVSVLGQRRIGKSSFVLHVAHPVVLQAHGLDAHRHCMVYVDCQGRGDLTEVEFCALLLQGLAQELAARGQKDAPGHNEGAASLQRLEDLISRSTAAGYRPVYMLDEFETIAASRNLRPDFFSSLRRIATQYPVAVVTVSKERLTSLTYTRQSVLSSPFFNIFESLWLGLFTHEDATLLLQELGGSSGLRFTQATLDFILDLAGRHPLLLQIAGFHAFELLQGQDGELSGGDRELLRSRFWATAAQHFEYYWNHLDTEARYALATLPLMSGSENRVLEKLLREECLIVLCDAGYDYLCSTFRDFVSMQEVPGLMHVGPFVVDHQQRAIMLQGKPLELTKTTYDLLLYLLERSGEVATYDELEENVWGDAFSGDPERLKAAIKHLRQALGEHSDCVANVRGVGYGLQV